MNANSNNRKKCGNNLTVGGRSEYDHKVPANSCKFLKFHLDFHQTSTFFPLIKVFFETFVSEKSSQVVAWFK